MNCREALPLIHEFLDGDLDESDARQLKSHLEGCKACKQELQQYERVDALVKSLPAVKAPIGMTSRIIQKLPEPKRYRTWLQWVKRHPALSVASIFLLVMIGTFFSMWNEDSELMIKGANLDNVVIENGTVYVPSGETLEGDLTVKNGKVQIDGEIKGNLIVIDGSYHMASTAKISGEIKVVDQVVDWIFFKANELLDGIAR